MFLIGWSHKFVPPIVPWFPLGIFQLTTPPCDSVHGHFLLLLIVSFLQLTSVDQALLLETHWPAPRSPPVISGWKERVPGCHSRGQRAAMLAGRGEAQSASIFTKLNLLARDGGYFWKPGNPTSIDSGFTCFFLFKLRKTKCKVLPHE